jgi:hypothetical protein
VELHLSIDFLEGVEDLRGAAESVRRKEEGFRAVGGLELVEAVLAVRQY